MTNIFRANPVKKLQKSYEQKMKAALLAQRGGDLQGYASYIADAESIQVQIDALRAERV